MKVNGGGGAQTPGLAGRPHRGGIWLLVGIVYLAVKTKGFRQLPPEMKIEE